MAHPTVLMDDISVHIDISNNRKYYSKSQQIFYRISQFCACLPLFAGRISAVLLRRLLALPVVFKLFMESRYDDLVDAGLLFHWII